MKTITLASWIIALSIENNLLHIVATNKDGTPVIDTDQDTGGDDELGYRLTSKGIEQAYDNEGEANADCIDESVKLHKWKVDIRNDSDNHLNIYISKVQSDIPEQVSVINGTENAPSCKIAIS